MHHVLLAFFKWGMRVKFKMHCFLLWRSRLGAWLLTPEKCLLIPASLPFSGDTIKYSMLTFQSCGQRLSHVFQLSSINLTHPSRHKEPFSLIKWLISLFFMVQAKEKHWVYPQNAHLATILQPITVLLQLMLVRTHHFCGANLCPTSFWSLFFSL